jgi:hypothetical protein
MAHEAGLSSTPRPHGVLALALPAEKMSAFFPLFQRGVTVPAVTGCSLRQLLCDQFGIPEEYVTGRITTIFLDNRPVDDLDRSLIAQGSRVTLSAAMPGLVGAVMRRSGFYAALRQGISHTGETGVAKKGDGSVRLKLFNLLLPELSPLFLARGIVLERSEFLELQTALPEAGDYCGSEEAVMVTASFSDGGGSGPVAV